jgi:hypothetical protein
MTKKQLYEITCQREAYALAAERVKDTNTAAFLIWRNKIAAVNVIMSILGYLWIESEQKYIKAGD